MLFNICLGLIFFLITCASSRPAKDERNATILNFKNVPYGVHDGIGSYEFSFQTSNGITREEVGEIETPEAEESELVVKGSYSYTAPDGKLIKVTYQADSNGFVVKQEGDIAPKT